MRIAIVSLGCPKNQVDADRFCRALIEAGHESVGEAAAADVLIVNTCGFITAAKEEAIEAIFDGLRLRERNPRLRVVVTGCLAERYRDEMAKEIPEIDAVVGIGCNAQLPSIVGRVCAGEGGGAPLIAFGPKAALPLGGPRVISTPSHYAWLKIAEGCSNRCSYCAIPSIRGPLRSRPRGEVVAEAEWLAEQGVQELVLVAQDVTAYGDDTGENGLLPLLRALEEAKTPRWIRLLYTYPERITARLVEYIAQSRKVLPYFDMPVQHCDDAILASMRRRGGAAAVADAIALVRGVLPQATLRTTLIAGYPGESEKQFERLCDFVLETRFDRLGCFPYSPEEGTRAARLPGRLPREECERRAGIIMEHQTRIMAEKQRDMVGKSVLALCDGLDEGGELWRCRSAADAPEIDAELLVSARAPLAAGRFFTLRVTAADGYDLTGELDTPQSEVDP